MKKEQFFNEAHGVSKRLANINDHIHQTVEVLERLLTPGDDRVEVSKWEVRGGKVYITFDSPVEIENVPEIERHVFTTLLALFPSAWISGTSIEIESSELL